MTGLTTCLRLALLSVYDKTGLLPFAEGLAKHGIKLLGSGGTAKAIRNAGLEIGYVHPSPTTTGLKLLHILSNLCWRDGIEERCFELRTISRNSID
jgi:hypothetical protein